MYSRDKIIATMREIYEGSKEIAPYVVIAQPRRKEDETPAQKFDGYEGLHVDLLGFSHGFCNIYGEKVDVARNYLIEQALESGAKYLFFIGEDTVVPYDAFKILHKTAEENPNSIVTGVYYIKLSDAMIMVRNGNWITIPNVDPGQLIEAWQTGMDCMLIPIELLKKMKEEDPEIPFCCIGNNIDKDIPFIGEDNFFVHRVHRMGIKLLVNTDVQCLHMDLASGKYTAHPSVDLRKYFTNIPITEPLKMEDKEYIDRRWIDRLPDGSSSVVNKINKMKEDNVPVKFSMGSVKEKQEGYISVDKNSAYADIKTDFVNMNIPENTADEILFNHSLATIPHHLVPGLLKKLHSSLNDNGKLVVETTNLEELCDEFVNADDQKRYELSLCIYGAYVDEVNEKTLKNGTDSPHLWGYYPNVLKKMLEEIGYSKIDIMESKFQKPGKNFRLEAKK